MSVNLQRVQVSFSSSDRLYTYDWDCEDDDRLKVGDEVMVPAVNSRTGRELRVTVRKLGSEWGGFAVTITRRAERLKRVRLTILSADPEALIATLNAYGYDPQGVIVR